MIERNRNYAAEGKTVIIEGVMYPLVKTSEKMVFYMDGDVIKRVGIKKAL